MRQQMLEAEVKALRAEIARLTSPTPGAIPLAYHAGDVSWLVQQVRSQRNLDAADREVIARTLEEFSQDL